MKYPKDMHVTVGKFMPVKKAPLQSWWAEPDVQTSRSAFHQRVSQELTRICGD
jgi:hypothetical protein